eukprot:scaffold2917_cov170-Ochromonas_danica.AAC.1
MSDYPSKTSFLSSSLHASSSSSSLSSSSSSSIIEDRKSFQALQGVVARQLAREQAVMGRKQQLLDSILVIGSTGARGGVGGGGGVSENQSPASRRPPPPAPPPPTATTATAAALLQRPMYGPQQKPEASSLHPSHYLFSSDQGEVVEVVTPLGGAGGEMLRSVGSLNTFASLASSTHKKSSLGPRSTAILNEIQSGYTTELSSFSSVALFVQARYLEMKNEDKGNRPSQLKASFVSDLALTLCKALGRYSQASDLT